MTNFLKRRIHSVFGNGRENLQYQVRGAECGVQLLSTEIFRHCGGTALQKTIRQLLFAIRRRFRLGRSLALPRFRRLKSALILFVINYGLKPVAWEGDF